MTPRRPDLPAAAIAAGLAGIALLSLWAAREFSMFGSIFPRTIGIAMLMGSVYALWRELRGTTPSKERPSGGLGRSAALVLVMAGWVAVLEWAGFALTSGVAFVILALIARRERATARTIVAYVLLGAVLVVGLQLLFERVLSVRLPDGVLLGKP